LTLYLASKSPRRQDILNKYNIAFEQVDHQNIEDRLSTDFMSPVDACAERAWCKAHAVTGINEGVVMGVDTMVCLNNIPFGQPKDRAHAKAILLSLMGHTHNVVTACCLCDKSASSIRFCIDIARVQIQGITDADLDAYLDSNLWQGKAGGYGIQDSLHWVHCSDGDFYTVMGLPINKLLKILDGYGIV
jgi:septum formation protein